MADEIPKNTLGIKTAKIGWQKNYQNRNQNC